MLQPHAVRLDRVVDPVDGDRERADREGARLQAVELVDVLDRAVVRRTRRRAGPARRRARTPAAAGSGPSGAYRRTTTYEHGVEDVVAVQVGQEDRVRGVQPRVALEAGQRPGAEVDQEPEAVGLDEVGRAGRLGAGEAAGAAENGQSHRVVPLSLSVVIRAGDGPGR